MGAGAVKHVGATGREKEQNGVPFYGLLSRRIVMFHI